MLTHIISLAIKKIVDRNPKRKTLRVKNAILSPADGKIIYVTRLKNTTLKYNNDIFSIKKIMSDGSINVAIYMSPLDVHINRSPIDGIVEKIFYEKGNFFRTSNKYSEIKNERNIIIIRNKKIKIAVIQIAAKFFGKIICNIKEGEKIKVGQSLGIITLGSQVNVLIPKSKNLKINVKTGKKVYAGVSILAFFKN